MKGSILPLQSLLFTWRLSRPDSQLQARQSVNHSEAIHGTQTANCHHDIIRSWAERKEDAQAPVNRASCSVNWLLKSNPINVDLENWGGLMGTQPTTPYVAAKTLFCGLCRGGVCRDIGFNMKCINSELQSTTAQCSRGAFVFVCPPIKMTETWGTPDWVNETADTEIIYGPHKHWDIGMLMNQCFCCQWKTDDLKLLTDWRKPLHLSDVWDPKHNY